MIEFDPVITLGVVIVWGTLIVLSLLLWARSSRNMRRLDRTEIKLEFLEAQIKSLRSTIVAEAKGGGNENGP